MLLRRSTHPGELGEYDVSQLGPFEVEIFHAGMTRTSSRPAGRANAERQDAAIRCTRPATDHDLAHPAAILRECCGHNLR